MDFSRKFYFGLFIIATLLGLVAAGESLLAHYDFVSSEFCTIGDTFNCDVVNKSEYSELLGVPVAALGLFAYVVFTVGIFWLRRPVSDQLMTVMLALAVGGLTFSLYLTYIEAFVLYTWCLVCLVSLMSIMTITSSLFAIRRIDAKIPTSTDNQLTS